MTLVLFFFFSVGGADGKRGRGTANLKCSIYARVGDINNNRSGRLEFGTASEQSGRRRNGAFADQAGARQVAGSRSSGQLDPATAAAATDRIASQSGRPFVVSSGFVDSNGAGRQPDWVQR